MQNVPNLMFDSTALASNFSRNPGGGQFRGNFNQTRGSFAPRAPTSGSFSQRPYYPSGGSTNYNSSNNESYNNSKTKVLLHLL